MRSNSFNWTYRTLVATASPLADCPIRDADPLQWHRTRDLLVRNEGRVGHFQTRTRDFSDTELEEIKHGLGQVYLDASSKDAPDDFARDLVPLRQSVVCRGCPFVERCTGLFEPVYENLFERDDERVRTLMGTLSGDVLDVGCGDGPYKDLLAPLSQTGRIRYTGIDPDEGRIRALRASAPWGRFEAATAEDFMTEGRTFDALLVLRSWNHLPSPERVVRLFERALHPGGTLLVVDNTAFGLARTPSQTHRAESSLTAAFEHHRNDLARDARRVFDRTALELVETHEVGRATSNQWLLRYVKAK